MSTHKLSCNCCQSGMWWAVMLVGVLMVLCGIAYWLWPLAGYVVASMLFGWMLIAAGVVQLIVSAGNQRPRYWGWWLVGGVLDIFVGFMLVRDVLVSEAVFAWFLSIVFVYWGVVALIDAVAHRDIKYWWIKLLNGLLLLFLGFFFIEAGFLQDVLMAAMLVSLAFIYWGLTLVSMSLDMKPRIHD